MAEELALFRRFPTLRDRFPRASFIESPTPVEPLPLDGVPPGVLFVKRDDRSCPLYAGNKPRKLEFVIGRALEKGSRALVTTGGLGTHHGLATTILGRAAGLETTLVLVAQPITDAVRETLSLHEAYGARMLYGGNVLGAAVQCLRALAGDTLRGARPTLVPTGGTSAFSNLGFVSAALELEDQVRVGALPEPDEIFVPVGTGGTLVGLVVGLRLSGLRTRVRGVLVTDILPPSPARLARSARATVALLREADPSLPALDLSPATFELLPDQLGAGYGAPTEAARDAQAAAGRAGLRLETTYTGKALAEIRVRAARGELPARVLFWNTYNGVDVAKKAPVRPAEERLPARFRRLLRAGQV